MTFLSKINIATAIMDLDIKRAFRALLGVETIAAAGSAQTDATALTGTKNVVTAANGTKGVILPVAELDMQVAVTNTVATSVLKVYPATGEQINALGANAAFSLAAGGEAVFHCDAIGHWYVNAMAAVTSTPAELNILDGVTASAAELNYNDITTLGTGAASKAVVLDAGEDYIWPATGILTYGVLKDPAGTTLGSTAAELNFLDGPTAGVATASKAAVLGANKNLDTLSVDPAGLKSDGVVISPIKWVDVTVTAALLDGAGTVNVIAGVAGDQYKIRDVRLVGGGTNFGAGGDRLINLTDGTTVWTTIANADIEAAPAATLAWGNAKVPFLTGTSDTASVDGQAIRFVYSGGTTDHGGTGSIKFSVALEKIA